MVNHLWKSKVSYSSSKTGSKLVRLNLLAGEKMNRKPTKRSKTKAGKTTKTSRSLSNESMKSKRRKGDESKQICFSKEKNLRNMKIVGEVQRKELKKEEE